MDLDAVPQENNKTFAGERKAMYAKDALGRLVIVPSTGWEVEEIVTTQAVVLLREQAEAARQGVLAGTKSTLEFWMYERRMDLALLAQTSGYWQWQVRRHLRPAIFARLSPVVLARYADALGITVDQLQCLP